MTDPRSYKLGPGSLIVGETGTSAEISCQITAASVEFSVDSDDDTPTLCGGTLAGDETETASLTGTIIQDLSDDGVIEYSWLHSGEVLPFVFVPNIDEAKQIAGQLKMRRLNVGGDVKTSPTSDFEWPIVGLPTLDVYVPPIEGDTEAA
jgi:hypothetical protein